MAILAALEVPAGDVDIDPDQSERYHEVGFLVRFAEPSFGTDEPFRVDTTELKAIAANEGVRQLNLSLCGVTADGASPDMLAALDIEASQAGRSPFGDERVACETWNLTPGDRPISIEVTPRRLADTGFAVTGGLLLAALGLLGAGAALRRVAVRRGRRPA